MTTIPMWRVSRTTDTPGSDAHDVSTHADYAEALDTFRVMLDGIDVDLFGPLTKCECHEDMADDESCEPCDAKEAAGSFKAEYVRGSGVTPRGLTFYHRPESWGISAVYRLELVA